MALADNRKQLMRLDDDTALAGDKDGPTVAATDETGLVKYANVALNQCKRGIIA